MNGTQWVYELVDKITSPLTGIYKALDLTDHAAQKTEKAIEGIGESSGAIDVFSSKVESATAHTHGLGESVLEVAAGFGLWTTIEAIGEGVIDTIKETAAEVEKVTKDNEKFHTVLANAMGEASSNEVFDMLERVTKAAPVMMDTLEDAYLGMHAKGFDPTYNDLLKIADVASFAGKPFEQLGEAIEMASLGSFKSLKQFGVVIKTSAKDTEHLTAMFHGQKTVIGNTEEAIRNYVLSIADMDGVHGASAKLMETLYGKEIEVANKTHELHEKLGEMFKPALDGWYEYKSNAVDGMIEWVNWLDEHGADIKDFFVDVAWGIGAATLAWSLFNYEQIIAGGALLLIKGLEAATWLWTGAQWALNIAMDANPIGIIIGLVGVMVFLIKELWDNSEGFRQVLYTVWESAKVVVGDLIDLFKGLGEIVIGVFLVDPAMVQQGIADASKILAIGDQLGAAAMTGAEKGSESYAADETAKQSGKKKKESPTDFLKKSVVTADNTKGAGANATGDGSSSSTGGSGGGGRNIHVVIQNLGSNISVHASTVKEGGQEIRRIIHEELIGAVRDFELSINNG